DRPRSRGGRTARPRGWHGSAGEIHVNPEIPVPRLRAALRHHGRRRDGGEAIMSGRMTEAGRSLERKGGAVPPRAPDRARSRLGRARGGGPRAARGRLGGAGWRWVLAVAVGLGGAGRARADFLNPTDFASLGPLPAGTIFIDTDANIL